MHYMSLYFGYFSSLTVAFNMRKTIMDHFHFPLSAKKSLIIFDVFEFGFEIHVHVSFLKTSECVLRKQF